MTNLNEWLEKYESTSAATQTILAFTLEKRVYMTVVQSLKGLPVAIYPRTNAQGIEYDALRLDLKQIDLLRLRDKGAALLGWAKDIFPKTCHNRGAIIEQFIIEKYHGQAAKASAPYYECGDAIICGQETQIKYYDSTLASLDTIREQWEKKKG